MIEFDRADLATKRKAPPLSRAALSLSLLGQFGSMNFLRSCDVLLQSLFSVTQIIIPLLKFDVMVKRGQKTDASSEGKQTNTRAPRTDSFRAFPPPPPTNWSLDQTSATFINYPTSLLVIGGSERLRLTGRLFFPSLFNWDKSGAIKINSIHLLPRLLMMSLRLLEVRLH